MSGVELYGSCSGIRLWFSDDGARLPLRWVQSS